MKAEDINDQETLKVWLQNRPHEDAVWIAHRAAMRVLPVWAGLPPDILTRKGGMTDLPILRALLTSGVGCKYLTPQVRAAAAALALGFDADSSAAQSAAAARAAAATHDYSAFAAALADAAALAAATILATDFADLATEPSLAATRAATATTCAAAVSAAHASSTAAWRQVTKDCVALQHRDSLSEVPVWVDAPNLFQAKWNFACAAWQANPDYAFWLRWYEAALAGTPPNWSLLHDLALIPNEDWEKGIGHIAGLIATFEERYHLLRQIAHLQEQLRDVTTLSTANAASPEHRSHNNPPDLINAPVEIRRAFTVITVALDDAKAELETPVPRPSVLRRAGHALLDAVKSILGYCAALGDIALKEGAKVVGLTGTKWAIGILAVSVSTQLPPLQSQARALLDFAQKLPTLH